MTALSLNLRNHLAQDYELRDLLARSTRWDTWIFDQKPTGAKIENTSRAMIVVNENGTWTNPVEGGSLLFPRLVLDIWADPTRNADLSVRTDDAQDKIVAIEHVLSKHLHLKNRGDRKGYPIVWGTPDQVLSGTGSYLIDCQRLTGPEFSPVRDSEGTYMGTYTYGVTLIA